ncbi:DUF411 domain-containing protein [Variovorax sp. PCZ-1]|uniref:DUF411 domain-containing protein n=1 Tax=Variovorax sp. PCZ-1 TaxID=2835533 RepID=UPI0020C00A30|nr:DUF411 domain-containing protein [Variovorax sp. PCZ-1]
MRSRRGVLGAALALLSSTSLVAACQAKDATPAEANKAKGGADHASHAPAAMSTVAFIEVWKTPNCGCCKLWIKILEKEGFKVKANNVAQTAGIRTKLGIPDDMGSCHTGLIAGFAIEGHVPASEIKRLLTEPESLRQQVIGLSVPGMPIGSPGMEMGTKRDKFDVMLVLKGGKSRVYQSYEALA